MFPFRVEMNDQIGFQDIEEKLKSNGWSDQPIDNSSLLYNEKRFYHELTHPCLFPDSKNSMIRQFVYNYGKDPLLKANADLFYSIHINRRIPKPDVDQIFMDEIIKPPDGYDFEKKTFSLIIEKIAVDVYEQGICIFSFHLRNEKYEKPEDILLINQFGRRLYPPFLDDHFMDFNLGLTDPLTGTQYREMPISISIGHIHFDKVIEEGQIEKDSLIYEDFTNKASKATDIGFPGIVQEFIPDRTFLPGHIGYFLGVPKNERDNKSKRFSISDEKVLVFQDSLAIKYVLDDRMFVLCWYGAYQLTYDYKKKKKTDKEEKLEYQYLISDLCNRIPGGYETSGLSRNLKHHKSLMMNKTANGYSYLTNKFWYQYIFIDGYGPTCSNDLMKEDLIVNHTYSRWVEANTLYGVSRYSFVCLTEPILNLQKPFPNARFIIDHMQTIYFKMVSLTLFQRAMVLKYAEEASIVSKDLRKKNETAEFDQQVPDLIGKIEILLKNYTEFINRVFHREVTAQEQGIELYDMLQKHLRIEYQAKELEKEIDELHRNIDLIRNREISNQLLNVNMKIATLQEEEHKCTKANEENKKRLDRITKLGGIILIPSVITALIQSRVLDQQNSILYWFFKQYFDGPRLCWIWCDFSYSFLINTFLFIFVGILSMFILLNSHKKYISQWIILCIAALSYMFLFPFDTWGCLMVVSLYLIISIKNLLKNLSDQKKQPQDD